MTEFELLALMAASLAHPGRTAAGSVALAGEILEEVKRQHPEAHAAAVRVRIAELQRRSVAVPRREAV